MVTSEQFIDAKFEKKICFHSVVVIPETLVCHLLVTYARASVLFFIHARACEW